MIEKIDYNEETDTLVIKLDDKLNIVTLENSSSKLVNAIMKALPDKAIITHYNNFKDEAEERKLI